MSARPLPPPLCTGAWLTSSAHCWGTRTGLLRWRRPWRKERTWSCWPTTRQRWGPSAAAARSRVRASLWLGIRGGCGACHGYVRPVHRPRGGRWPPPRPTPAPLQNARPLLTPAGRPRCVCAAAGGALPAAGDRRGLRGGGPRGDRRAVRSLLHGPQPLLRAQQGEPGARAQAGEQPPLPALMMAAADGSPRSADD
jgi:hypothetical protein